MNPVRDARADLIEKIFENKKKKEKIKMKRTNSVNYGRLGRPISNGVKKRNEKGFTLIELMIVVVILSILAAIVVPRFMGREEQAKRTATVIQIANFKQALSLYKLDNGFYPSTEQGLKALVEKPTTGKIPRSWKEGGYLEAKKIPLDPWRNPYLYISPGVHNKEYDIVSYAADGEEGGEGNDADIQSWALE